MTVKPDRSAFLPARIRILLVSVLLFLCSGIFTSCEKTDDSGLIIGTVKKDGKVSHIRFGGQHLNEGKLRYFALDFYHYKGVYPYGGLTFYNIPITDSIHKIEPKLMDSLTRAYILDSVSCVSYTKLDVDAIDGFFRLITDHPVNDFRITEVDTIAGIIKGTFSLAFERDPFLTNPLLDSSELNEVAIFTNGNFNFTYKQ